jgi:hypothetical protein
MKHDGGRGQVRESRGAAFDWYVRVRISERDAWFLWDLLGEVPLEGDEATRGQRIADAIQRVLSRQTRTEGDTES